MNGSYLTLPQQPLVYDLAYTVEVGVGTPPQLFNLMIDIATADTYLDSKEDQEDDWECTSHNFYESEASSTFETNHTLTNTQFMFKAFNASGEVSGDVFRLGSMEVADHRFINSVNNTAQGMWLDSLCPVDGILGFSPPEFASDINSSSAFATLARQGHLDKNLFALRLRDPTELSLGGINPTQFTGKIVRVPMRDEDKGRVATGWQTKTDYLMFGSEPALHYVLGGIPTSFAMSMFPMYLPGWMVSDILASLEFEEVDFYAVFNRLQPKRLSPRLDLQL